MSQPLKKVTTWNSRSKTG